MYLSTQLGKNPKIWDSLVDFLRSEFKARLNEKRMIVLQLPSHLSGEELVCSFPVNKEYTEEQALISFAFSHYFADSMGCLNYKVYRVSEMY